MPAPQRFQAEHLPEQQSGCSAVGTGTGAARDGKCPASPGAQGLGLSELLRGRSCRAGQCDSCVCVLPALDSLSGLCCASQGEGLLWRTWVGRERGSAVDGCPYRCALTDVVLHRLSSRLLTSVGCSCLGPGVMVPILISQIKCSAVAWICLASPWAKETNL